MTDQLSRREVRLGAYALAACAIILISTLSFAIVHKVNQGDAALRTAVAEANQITELAGQLSDANRQLNALRANITVATARSEQATKERAALNGEVMALVKALRNHGIPIPVNVVTPSTGQQPSNRPKGSQQHRHPKHPASTAGTGTPSTITITELCAMVPIPMLCP